VTGKRKRPASPIDPEPVEDPAAALADRFLFMPPRHELRGRPFIMPGASGIRPVAGESDGWGRALRHDRESGRAGREVFPVKHPDGEA